METQLQATNSNLQDQNQVHSNRLQANEQDTIPHMLNNEEFSQDDKQQLTGSDITIAMMASEVSSVFEVRYLLISRMCYAFQPLFLFFHQR